MRLIEKVWFYSHPTKWLLVPLLLPFSALFLLIISLRKIMYRTQMLHSHKVAVPIVVVGNIGVGGNGKTPVTLWLVQQLQAKGVKVGVVSRGYGAKAPHYPYQVNKDSSAAIAGDEPLLIYRRTNAPVVIDSDRVAACQALVQQGCQLIIADDGLQHYRLHRDYELVVIDAKRLFGNGLVLPAGPLRELTSRIAQADHVVINGQFVNEKDNDVIANVAKKIPVMRMQLQGRKFINIKSGISVAIDEFLTQYCPDKSINALAAIGDPARFFNALQHDGFTLQTVKAMVDHQALSSEALAEFSADIPLVMTEKDAVKCIEFAKDHYWYLPVDAKFDDEQESVLLTKILNLSKN